jgi:hypothetical protein
MLTAACPYSPHVTEEQFEYALRGAEIQARKFARRRVNPCLPLEDLEQEARLGVLVAAQRFDPAKNVLFTSYAFHYSYGFASNGERRYNPLPSYRLEQIKKAEAPDADPDLAQKWGRRPYELDTFSLAELEDDGDWEPAVVSASWPTPWPSRMR